MTDYVHATGNIALSVPNETAVKVPVSARYGNPDYIVGGRFVCPTAGIWRFDVKVWSNGGHQFARLLDETGATIEQVTYSGQDYSSNPLVTGYTFLNLAVGAKVWLGVSQGSGATQSVPATTAANWMALTATYQGAT